MATNDVAPPPPEDVHDGCGYAAADSGPVALVCSVERSYTTRSDISFYATEDQACAAAAHCRDTTSVGHTIVTARPAAVTPAPHFPSRPRSSHD